jgi:uncharacterized integral membrane protein
MKFISVLILMILVFFGITFSLENTTPISLTYYDVFKFQIPAYLLIFICFLIGIVVSGFLGLVERFKLSRRLSRLKKEIKDLETEIYEIRKMQIQNVGGPAIKKEYLS